MDDTAIAAIRIVHVGAGAFWFGSAALLALVLPIVRSQMGGDLVALLIARTWAITFMTVSGAVAVLAGLALYLDIWRGVGFVGPAVWYANGGHAAILALLISAGVLEPAARRLRTLTREDPPNVLRVTVDLRAQCASLMRRITIGVQVNAGLLLIAASLMAAARYA